MVAGFNEAKVTQFCMRRRFLGPVNSDSSVIVNRSCRTHLVRDEPPTMGTKPIYLRGPGVNSLVVDINSATFQDPSRGIEESEVTGVSGNRSTRGLLGSPSEVHQ